jgi:hypothetical protein
VNQVLLKSVKDIAVKQKRIYYKGVVVEALVEEKELILMLLHNTGTEQ